AARPGQTERRTPAQLVGDRQRGCAEHDLRLPVRGTASRAAVECARRLVVRRSGRRARDRRCGREGRPRELARRQLRVLLISKANRIKRQRNRSAVASPAATRRRRWYLIVGSVAVALAGLGALITVVASRRGEKTTSGRGSLPNSDCNRDRRRELRARSG